MIFKLFFLICLFATLANAQRNNYAAAKCAADGPRCQSSTARQSGYCKPARYMSAQPYKCRRAACAFCSKSPSRRRSAVCRSESIRKNCFSSNPSTPRPPTSPPAPPSGGRTGRCSFRANNNGNIVVPLWRQALKNGWTRQNDFIIWKKNGGRGLDPTGSGSICISFVAPRDATYYMTATSKAPHGTEHNDAWFMFKSPGLNFWRPQTGSWKVGKSNGTPSATGWHKGFQNSGRNRLADYVSTFDHNGHQFITKPLNRGQTYTACVSGRSTRFAISKLIFIPCSGRDGCARQSSVMKNAMRTLPLSQCV